MRTRAIVVATLVLLAGASSALAAAPNVHIDRGVESNAVTAQDDAQNETFEYENVTIETLNMTNVSVQQAVLNETVLEQSETNDTNPVGTATASNLTVVNATLDNVTLEDVTIRNETVAQQLFGEETPPEEENVTVENATLSEVSVESLRINSSLIGTVGVNDVQTSISPAGTENATLIEGQPTIAVGNMTVGSALFDSVEAGSVSIENASIGIGVLAGGGLGDGEETTTVGNETDGNENNSFRAPER